MVRLERLCYCDAERLQVTTKETLFCERSSNMLVSVGLAHEMRLLSMVLESKNETLSQSRGWSRGVEFGAKYSSITEVFPAYPMEDVKKAEWLVIFYVGNHQKRAPVACIAGYTMNFRLLSQLEIAKATGIEQRLNCPNLLRPCSSGRTSWCKHAPAYLLCSFSNSRYRFYSHLPRPGRHRLQTCRLQNLIVIDWPLLQWMELCVCGICYLVCVSIFFTVLKPGHYRVPAVRVFHSHNTC